MSQLKVGVIGVGHLGQHHARLYSSLPDSRLIGVADINEERAHHVTNQFGGTPYADFHHLLNQVEAVSVAVPTSSHFPVVQECLERGIHVLVEKPIALTAELGHCLVDLALKKTLILQVGHIERFNPVWEGLRPQVHAPYFIESQRLSPFQPRGTDVDVIRDLMIHDLDLILSLNLGPVQTIDGFGMAVLSSSVDFAHAKIQFERGCVASFTSSRISPERARRACVLQEDSYMFLDYQTRQGVIHGRAAMNPVNSASQTFEHAYPDAEEPLKRELQSFLHSVRTGTPPVISGEEGTLCLEIAEQILATLTCGSPLTHFACGNLTKLTTS